MSQPRTQHTDASTWTPFDSAPDADGQSSATHTDTSPSTTPSADTDGRSTDGQSDTRPRDGRSDVRQVAVHGTDGTRRRWQIIEGGHDDRADGFDAAADEALGVAADTARPAVKDTAPTTAPATPVEGAVSETAPATVETPAPSTASDPVETPVETRSEADSTLPTPHPDPEHPETENAGDTGTEAAETPHSTPRWHAYAAALNPGGVLYRQQASLAEIVAYADHASYSDNRAVRTLERGWNRAVAVPVSLLLYSTAAAYKRLWRGLGTSAIGVLWIAAVHAAPADTSTVWTWIVLGYWAVSALIVPVIVTKK